MINNSKSLLCAAAMGTLFVLQACSAPAPSATQPSANAPSNAVSAGSQGTGAVPATPTGVTVASPTARSGFAPGDSLAFEWSANGFEQLPARYTWSGTGKRDDVYQPNFSLSQAETDDIIWSASCGSGDTVKTSIYLNPPELMTGNRANFRFETDTSRSTLTYPAKFIESGQFSGFEITQSVNDPMFKDMKSGTWAYLQMGEGSKSVKLRVSLANASRSLSAFLPACSAASNASPRQSQIAPTPTPRQPATSVVTAQYTCEDGRSVSAVYAGNDTDKPSVRLTVDGKGMTLNQVVSGSGARYESLVGLSAGRRFTWHSKGNTAVIVETDRNDTDGSTEIITNCQET